MCWINTEFCAVACFLPGRANELSASHRTLPVLYGGVAVKRALFPRLSSEDRAFCVRLLCKFSLRLPRGSTRNLSFKSLILLFISRLANQAGFQLNILKVVVEWLRLLLHSFVERVQRDQLTPLCRFFITFRADHSHIFWYTYCVALRLVSRSFH
jgi:hypothetical protein